MEPASIVLPSRRVAGHAARARRFDAQQPADARAAADHAVEQPPATRPSTSPSSGPVTSDGPLAFRASALTAADGVQNYTTPRSASPAVRQLQSAERAAPTPGLCAAGAEVTTVVWKHRLPTPASARNVTSSSAACGRGVQRGRSMEVTPASRRSTCSPTRRRAPRRGAGAAPAQRGRDRSGPAPATGLLPRVRRSRPLLRGRAQLARWARLRRRAHGVLIGAAGDASRDRCLFDVLPP